MKRSAAIRRLSVALALAGLATVFATGCVVREPGGYNGSYGYDRNDRRDDTRNDRHDDYRRDDDRRDGERRY